MTEMLGRLAADRALEEEALVHEAQTIFSCCFHEVIRQVALHTAHAHAHALRMHCTCTAHVLPT